MDVIGLCHRVLLIRVRIGRGVGKIAVFDIVRQGAEHLTPIGVRTDFIRVILKRVILKLDQLFDGLEGFEILTHQQRHRLPQKIGLCAGLNDQIKLQTVGAVERSIPRGQFGARGRLFGLLRGDPFVQMQVTPRGQHGLAHRRA